VFNQYYTTTPASVTIPNLASGNYWVKAQYLTTSWTEICKKEVSITVGGGGTPCTITGIVGIKVCNNNGTPSNPNDDTYTFEFTGNSTGSCSSGWHGTVGNEQISGTYGVKAVYGPYPIGNGAEQNIWIMDNVNSSVNFDISITPPATCSGTTSGPDCNAVTFTTSNGGIVITGLTAPVIMVQVFNSAWNTVFNENYTVSPGTITIPNLPGTYFVKVTFLNSNWTTICAKEGYVTIPPSNNPGSIGDCVWNDLNRNGIKDPNEPGVPNVPVQLKDCQGNTLQTTQTNATGFYNFPNLQAGCYRVCVTPPSGFEICPQNQGSNDAVDSDVNPTTGCTANINLAQGQNDPTQDAGICQIQTPPGSIGDCVWNDLNRNGIKDPNEPGVPNVPVVLKDCQGNTLQSTSTNASGFYTFTPLNAGCYRVCVTPPTGFQICAQNQGTNDAVDSDVDPTTGCTANINLAQGQNDPTQDAGICQISTVEIVCRNYTTTTTSSNTKVTYPIPTGSTTCPGGQVNIRRLSGPESGSTFPVGTTQVCYEVSDNCGNTKSCCFNIVVNVCPPQSNSFCFVSPTKPNQVSAKIDVTDNGNTLTIRTWLAKTFVDNTYGTNAIGWPNGHTFNNLVGSDNLKLSLMNSAGTKVLEFQQDYITASSGAPSGFDCLGVTGGEGKMLVGSATNIVSATTSLDQNMNTFGYNLQTNSPATTANYTPNPTYPNWIYDVWYEVTVLKSAFGASGFGSPMITGVHASPSKTGSNTELVNPTPCPPPVICGPINLVCQSNITLSATSANGAVVTFSTPTATTTCASGGLAVMQSSGLVSGSTFPAGTTKVCFVAKDACGNLAECCFDVTVTTTPPNQVCNCNGAKIAAVRLLYNGADCSQGNNTQGGKATCTGSIGSTTNTNIRISSAATGGSTWFQGTVSQGQAFTMAASNGGATKFGSDSYYTVGGQSGKFHTSCSQPFNVGDQYGGLRVLGMQFDNGTTCGDMNGTGTPPGPPTTVVTGGMCDDCDAYMSVQFNGCQSITVTSCKDLSNVVIRTANGTETKFDNLNGTSRTFTSPNGSNITTVWVKSGCFQSGDGPGYGRKFSNSVNCSSGNSVIQSTDVSLAATRSGNEVNLRWVSNSGLDNAAYIVERSEDGIHYASIATGDGFSADEIAHYNEVDAQPAKADNFYRVRMILRDGSERVSNEQRVFMPEVGSFGLYPNPANERVTLDASDFVGQNVQVQLFNQLGKLVKTVEADATSGLIEIDLTDMNSGFYGISIESNGVKRSSKLLVTKQ
jgi:hypothetical protein